MHRFKIMTACRAFWVLHANIPCTSVSVHGADRTMLHADPIVILAWCMGRLLVLHTTHVMQWML